jgi:hypothetical protein
MRKQYSYQLRHGRSLDVGPCEKIRRPLAAAPRNLKDWR